MRLSSPDSSHICYPSPGGSDVRPRTFRDKIAYETRAIRRSDISFPVIGRAAVQIPTHREIGLLDPLERAVVKLEIPKRIVDLPEK